MKQYCTRAVAAALLFAPGLAFAQPILMDWVTVGNAGNAADPTTGFGSVGYEYRIGTYEVTNAQYAAFLNAVAASDPNQLYTTLMGSDARGGITRSGSDGSYTYSVKANMGNKPVNFVNWYDAARMANWMTNGQGSGGTESGVYTLTGIDSISTINRDLSNPNQVFIPNEDEWYKAAYHQPETLGGDSDGYWLYPTASNSVPTIAMASSTGDISNPGTNVANYLFGADWNSVNGHVTTVGSAGPDSASFYGTSDQGGNVWEWNETLFVSSRGIRGGSWEDFEDALRSSEGSHHAPTDKLPYIGFRLARPVPGPGPVALVAVGAPLLARRRRR
ncbi:MAG: formylglycine-generating enzyme family protein [Phycisphaerales bacterium JB037]